MSKTNTNTQITRITFFIGTLVWATIGILSYLNSKLMFANISGIISLSLLIILLAGIKINTNNLLIKIYLSLSLAFAIFLIYSIRLNYVLIYISVIIFPWMLINLWQQSKIVFATLLVMIFIYPAMYIISATDYPISHLSIQIVLFLLSGIVFYIISNNSNKLIDEQVASNDELQKEIDSQKTFLQSFSHQLRTPLNNIIGINDFFARTELDDIQQDYLDTIAASAYTLVDVVEILDKRNKVRFEKENEDNDKIKFNIYLTLNNFIDFAKSQNKNLNINLLINENFPPRIIGNPIKLKQILFHVLESYNKYNSEKTLDIEIHLKSDSDSEDSINYHFEIKKLGKLHISKAIELEDKSQEKLLEILDIKIVRDICKNIACKLYVNIEDEFSSISLKGIFDKISRLQSSEYDKRETIYKKPLNQSKEFLAYNEASDEEILRTSNVLLVEDNLINQKVILLALETLVANIDVANNGKEALDVFGKTKYDIILMDIQMPVMDGIKASIKIREIEKTTNSYTPIIAVTANAMQGDENSCLDVGMDKYMTKPIQMDKLKAYMAELIRKHNMN
jgi:CheY-like chemotaxis protein